MHFVLWEADGNRTEGDIPDEEPLNILNQRPSERRASIGFELEDVLGNLRPVDAFGPPKAVCILGANSHVALLVSFQDGREIVVRVPSSLDQDSRLYRQSKLFREAEMLCWMSSCTTIPVPRVVQDATELSTPFLATTKCEGEPLAWAFGGLSDSAQAKNMRSYASIALQMYGLKCPQVIGSLARFVPGSDEPVHAGPCIYGNHSLDSPSTFCDLRSYFTWLISVKKDALQTSSWSDDDKSLEEQFWTDLGELITREIAALPSSMLRIVPVHQDFVAHNVVIHPDGEISGLYDWEFHSLLPVVLAADYPSWIKYSGHHSPCFTHIGGNFSTFWNASPETAQRLRNEYDSIVQTMDLDYYAALKQGTVLRDVYEWMVVHRSDRGCRMMRKWLNSVAV